MEWFTTWWNSIGLLGQIFACSAIPMTVVMFLQFILMIIGVGFGSDTDGDVDNDGSGQNTETTPEEAGNSGYTSILKIFTIRGIVAFFALGGWAGLAALTAGIPALWTIQIALFVGVSALLLASIVIRLALRMQASGNINLNNALSQTAEVYIRIPPSRTEKGKVTMLLQERFVELDAVTDSEIALLPETKVEVVALQGNDCLVVRATEINKE
jgi:membrane protein implicated in regulation of membrane protease activity